MSVYGQKQVVNISTGQITLVDLTPDEVTARDADRAAAAVVIPSPFFDYASPFVNNAELWVKIHKALDDVRSTFVQPGTAATISANLKQQVTNVVAVILTAPQGVIDAFNDERILQGVSATLNPAGIAALTDAQCRILINVARTAANQGAVLALASFVLKSYIDSQ